MGNCEGGKLSAKLLHKRTYRLSDVSPVTGEDHSLKSIFVPPATLWKISLSSS